MFRIYDKQKDEYRDEVGEDRNKLAEQFRHYWYEVNYDSEYEDIISMDLDENASKEEVEKVMHERVYGVLAEAYLNDNGFEIHKI